MKNRGWENLESAFIFSACCLLTVLSCLPEFPCFLFFMFFCSQLTTSKIENIFWMPWHWPRFPVLLHRFVDMFDFIFCCKHGIKRCPLLLYTVDVSLLLIHYRIYSSWIVVCQSGVLRRALEISVSLHNILCLRW